MTAASEPKIVEYVDGVRTERDPQHILVRSGWIKLHGGPAGDAFVEMPLGAVGDFVIHSTALHLEEYQDEDGEWHYRHHDEAQHLGPMIYRVTSENSAEFVSMGHNPTDESEDGDLEVRAPYLQKLAIVEGDSVAVGAP